MNSSATRDRIACGFIMRALLLCLLLSFSLPARAHSTPIAFDITYGDAAAEGFNDPALGGKRKAALTFATSVWSNVIQASFPGETIKVSASFDPLGGDANEAELGQGGFPFTVFDFGAGQANTSYPPALANHVAKKVLPLPAGAYVALIFNSDVDNNVVFGDSGFFYGNPGAGQGTPPAGDVDFVTVALHEIGHGLGFISNVQADGTLSRASIYDRFITDNTGKHLDNMPPIDRKTAITQFLQWESTFAQEEDGAPFKLYAPAVFEPGSSIAHLDPTTFGTALMLPTVESEANIVTHELIDPERFMLKDIGWTVDVPLPSALSLVMLGLAALWMIRRQVVRH